MVIVDEKENEPTPKEPTLMETLGFIGNLPVQDLLIGICLLIAYMWIKKTKESALAKEDKEDEAEGALLL